MRKKSPQNDLPGDAVASVFNLRAEEGIDPERVERERIAAERAALDREAFALRMQRTLEQCPGVIGFDIPPTPASVGRLVIEAGKATDARAWIKRRFHASDAIELSGDGDLVFEIKPKLPRAQGSVPKRSVVRFGKTEQFELALQ